MNIKGLEFEQTCEACPEQYEVFDKNNNHVGYVRLRWGGLTCEYPDVGGKLIYQHSFNDGWMGCFENEKQREFHLNAIAEKILEILSEDDFETEVVKNQNVKGFVNEIKNMRGKAQKEAHLAMRLNNQEDYAAFSKERKTLDDVLWLARKYLLQAEENESDNSTKIKVE